MLIRLSWFVEHFLCPDLAQDKQDRAGAQAFASIESAKSSELFFCPVRLRDTGHGDTGHGTRGTVARAFIVNRCREDADADACACLSRDTSTRAEGEACAGNGPRLEGDSRARNMRGEADAWAVRARGTGGGASVRTHRAPAPVPVMRPVPAPRASRQRACPAGQTKPVTVQRASACPHPARAVCPDRQMQDAGHIAPDRDNDRDRDAGGRDRTGTMAPRATSTMCARAKAGAARCAGAVRAEQMYGREGSAPGRETGAPCPDPEPPNRLRALHRRRCARAVRCGKASAPMLAPPHQSSRTPPPWLARRAWFNR